MRRAGHDRRHNQPDPSRGGGIDGAHLRYELGLNPKGSDAWPSSRAMLNAAMERARGEAVVVPKVATMRMNASAGPAVRAACGLDGKDGNMVGVWNCFLAASPYVIPEASA